MTGKTYLTGAMLESNDHITKTSLFKYTENFTTKNWKISDKKSNTFRISARNIDCGYSFELPEAILMSIHNLFLSRNNKKNVYPWKPQFYYIKSAV